MVKRLRPTLITLDVMMPGMDGWAVLSKLKEDPELAEIPVVMLTIMDDQHFGHALGATEYLTKPVDREKLLATIRRLAPPDFAGLALVVDDDPIVRDVLVHILERQGWSTATADDGVAALEAVSGRKPDLILLDLMMPRMDGFEFASELRKRPNWRSIPVVVITGKSLTQEDRLALQGHVHKVIQKGNFNHDQLLVELRDIVSECVQRARAIESSARGRT
jgi:CheY-like chemotaxis protein